MRDAPSSRSANGPHDPLWTALADYVVGPADAALPFTDRLARENGWSADQAERVVDEYRRFLFLAVRAGHAVTPSDAVDQAWHLHLTYSRDYWEKLCPLLGQPLHHGPTRGGADESARFHRAYAETLRSYEHWFGQPAPADLWPSAQQRLFDDPRARRVHPRDGLVVSRPQAMAALALAALCGAAVAAITLFQGGT